MAAPPLFIRLPGGDEPQVSWCDPTRGPEAAAWSDLAALATGHTLVAIVPGDHLLLTRVQAPKTSRGRLIAAAPFLLEERLAGSPEALWFGLGERQADGFLTVAVVAETLRQGWLAALDHAGARPGEWLAEPLLLPWRPGSWTLLLDDTLALARLDETTGFAVEPATLDAALRAALRERERPTALQLIDATTTDHDHTPLAALNIPLMITRDPRPRLRILASHAPARTRHNPLHDLGGSRRGEAPSLTRAWHTALALLLIGLVGQGLVSGWHVQQLAAQESSLLQQVESRFRGLFPEVRRLVKPADQARQALLALRTAAPRQGSSLLARLDQVAEALTPEERVTAIDHQTPETRLTIATPSGAALSGLKERLSSLPGLHVTLEPGEGNTGRFLVRGKEGK